MSPRKSERSTPSRLWSAAMSARHAGADRRHRGGARRPPRDRWPARPALASSPASSCRAATWPPPRPTVLSVPRCWRPRLPPAAFRPASPSIRRAPTPCARPSTAGIDVTVDEMGVVDRPGLDRVRRLAASRRQPCRGDRALRHRPDGRPRNMRGVDVSPWTAPLDDLFLGGPWRKSASATAATRSAWASCRPG